MLCGVVILIVLFDARTLIGAPERLLKSTEKKNKQTKNKTHQLGCACNAQIVMEVIETIVIQNAEVEGKETVVCSVEADKSKTGELLLSGFHRMKRGVSGEPEDSASCREAAAMHPIKHHHHAQMLCAHQQLWL